MNEPVELGVKESVVDEVVVNVNLMVNEVVPVNGPGMADELMPNEMRPVAGDWPGVPLMPNEVWPMTTARVARANLHV